VSSSQNSRTVRVFLSSTFRDFAEERDADNLIRIWDLDLGTFIKVLEGHTGYVESLELSNHGRILLSGSNDYSVRIWDSESGSI
jgi:WD40 repeat protein